mmetsp:Transcript_65974/g.191175  ORF Transcript_65974/g.191175 Transcript_65974/m.191175 type:complete len:205 (-) Transcript_65974:115-729(-)
MKLSTFCLSFCLLASQGQAFQQLPVSKGSVLGSSSASAPRTAFRFLHAKRSLDGEEEESTGIPQLPAFGASSFSTSHADFSTGVPSSSPIDSPDAAFVSPKFKLQYTCNICETRNSHMVSRLAYREGVVIAICKGCKSKHLIADNLNETPGMNGGSNIEDYFKSRGMDDAVIRVNHEVFALENIMRFNSASGSLVGDDGNPVLE